MKTNILHLRRYLAVLVALMLLGLGGCSDEQAATVTVDSPATEERPGQLESPIISEDGSIHAGEPYVRQQATLFENGNEEQKKTAIIDLELSEGGVILLSHIIRTEPNRAVVIEAVQRLDIGEEFGARWAMLDALDHKDPDVLLEILASLEVWRDPTIRRYLQPLVSHTDSRVSERTKELLEDIRIYADLDAEAEANSESRQ